MPRSLKATIEVVRRLGLKAISVRSLRAIGLKSGLSVKKRPISRLTNEILEGGNYPSPTLETNAFYTWWGSQNSKCFDQDPKIYQSIAGKWLSSENINELRQRAVNASKGKILAFRSWVADYGQPVKWDRDPVTKNHWPNKLHSLKIGHQPSDGKLRDIKYVWEIARFIHLADIVRYLYINPDKSIARETLKQIRSFEENNPINQGVNWISEQEVAIRTCMFTRLLFALKALQLLNEGDALLLMRQIIAGAEFCYKENNFARHCIANNHFLSGALGMYLPAILFPWHPHSARWRKRGRRDILESLGQWNNEGGYVQPAHNYHRLALNYLLHAKIIADADNDSELSNALTKTIAKSESFLFEFIDQESGLLPNWGPNDGAQLCSWTSCPYEDFRPVVKAAQYAINGVSPITIGPWDEYLYWMFNHTQLQPKQTRPQTLNAKYPTSGLQIVRHKEAKIAGFFRTGPINSRYGQQADLLHFDLFHKGRNVLIDAGSYSYGETRFHNWFRSVFAHNTLHITGHDQMTPFSKFLYINWPETKIHNLSASPNSNFTQILSASHNGYKRVARGLRHTRTIGLHKEGFFTILDQISTPSPLSKTAVVRWNLERSEHKLNNNSIEINYPDHSFQIKWSCNRPYESSIFEGSENPIAGWSSRAYGIKIPSTEIHIKSKIEPNLKFLTIMGPAAITKNISISFKLNEAFLNGEPVPY